MGGLPKLTYASICLVKMDLGAGFEILFSKSINNYMPFLTSPEIIKELPYNAMIDFLCSNCNKNYKKKKINSGVGNGLERDTFCSRECKDKSQEKNKHKIICLHCNKQFISRCNAEKYRKFCSKSCSAHYNNTHKKQGTRRSKLEKWLEQSLSSLYPNLEIHYNKKDAINSELDIFIPSLKLAFELNGIYHYEPIHGDKILNRIKNNDNRKFQACLERNIELCIIDTSHQVYFKEQTSNMYLNLIKCIIDNKLEPGVVFYPPTKG